MTISGKIVVHSQSADYNRGLGVVIGYEAPNGSFAYIKGPLVFENLEPGHFIGDPTFDGRHGSEFLQAALEHAWSIGMRPKNWRVETTEQVAAMDNHLQDMRRLVFKGEGA